MIVGEIVEFVFNLCRSICVLVRYSWCIISTNCANGICGPMQLNCDL